MPKTATKAADNIFYKSRMAASSFNDRLKSREGASEETGIDRTRIAYIELDTITPYPEEVLILAEQYNAPELCNHYCSKMCALGKRTVNPVEVSELGQVVLQLLSVFQLIPSLKEQLINIAADGIVDETERQLMEEIIVTLDKAANKIQSLKIYFKKYYGSSDRTNL